MVHARAASISAMLAFVVTSASAREPVNVVVEFNAPPGCSDRETFATGLRARSSHIRIADSNERGWVVGVRLVPNERGVHGELRLTDDRGGSELRAVDGVDCAEVVEALSLTATLAIEQIVALSTTDPTAARPVPQAAASVGGAPSSSPTDPRWSNRQPSTATPQTKEQVPSEAKSRDATSDAFDAEREMNHLLLSAFAGQQVYPQTSFGVTLVLFRSFAITRSWISEVGLGAVYVPSVRLQPKNELGVSYYGASLLGCPVVWSIGAAVALSPCATVELAQLTVTDRTVDASFPSKRLNSTLGVLGRGRVQLARHVELELQLALLTALPVRHYVVTDTPHYEVGRTNALGWRAGIGWLFGW